MEVYKDRESKPAETPEVDQGSPGIGGLAPMLWRQTIRMAGRNGNRLVLLEEQYCSSIRGRKAGLDRYAGRDDS